MREIKMKKKIKAWIIEDGRWATNQMLVYQTRKSAEERIYQGGMAKEWKAYPCIITLTTISI